jgi:hypothetical protein
MTETRVAYGATTYPAHWWARAIPEPEVYTTIVLVEKGELSAQDAMNKIDTIMRYGRGVVEKAKLWAAMYGDGYQYEQAEAADSLYREVCALEARNAGDWPDDLP